MKLKLVAMAMTTCVLAACGGKESESKAAVTAAPASIELALVDMADFFDSKPENTNNTGSKGERNGEDEHPK